MDENQRKISSICRRYTIIIKVAMNPIIKRGNGIFQETYKDEEGIFGSKAV
ncbi:hypothetical protein JOD29_000052 [Lysinibacillus composti]|uniref:hypothetical protein n=1 Tax=Lysinibacillus composti TaxID=720633 RepID=UPI001315666F|nr:hypothetical protein [Lysinibacillus composti]MBM7606815.1 hypothetical protein [Lysinibacillus composti]